jgi:hypothetical protein
MAGAFAAYEAARSASGDAAATPASGRYNEPLSIRRRRETRTAPSWLVGTVKSLLRFSTAGASDLVAAANREVATRVLNSSPPVFTQADCTAAPSMSECQRQPESEPFSGGNAVDLQQWQSRLDRLDGLITFRGKYGRLPIIQQLRGRWREGQAAASARAAYRDWQRTDSYASFMDAVVAELKDSGDYDRLIEQRLKFARVSPSYEKDIRTAMLLNPGKDRCWVEEAMRDFLADWERFEGDASELGVLGRKQVLWQLLEGERVATERASTASSSP